MRYLKVTFTVRQIIFFKHFHILSAPQFVVEVARNKKNFRRKIAVNKTDQQTENILSTQQTLKLKRWKWNISINITDGQTEKVYSRKERNQQDAFKKTDEQIDRLQ